VLQPETRSSIRTNFSVSYEDLQDLRFSECVVEDSGLQGCDIVLLRVSFCFAGTWDYMWSRYIGLLVNMGWIIRGGGGQGMVVFGGPA
jgi:hypothetical protein